MNHSQHRDEVFNWADYETPAAQHVTEVVPYQSQPAPAVIPPNVTVVMGRDGVPHYKHIPQPAPAYDPMPQRMAGLGILSAGVGVLAVGVGAGSFLFFSGMSMAEHALVALAIVAGSIAIVLFILKNGASVHVSNVRIGDNSNFQIGGRSR